MKHSYKTVLYVFVVVLLVVGGIWGFIYNQQKAGQNMLDRWGFASMSIEEIVTTLDTVEQRLSGLDASITDDELILTDEQGTFRFDLPKDKFYISFAPYINQTHPCAFHSLSGCQGELINQTFFVTITGSNNEIIVQEEMTSATNGFVGIWLPRGISGTLHVQYNNLEAETFFTTHDNSNTCITTPLILQ